MREEQIFTERMEKQEENLSRMFGRLSVFKGQ